MAKPYWLVKSLAIFTLVLFTVDTSSDGYVGYDLYNRCHYRYAASVLTFVAIPGVFLGVICAKIIIDPKDDESFIEKYGFWRGLLASISIVFLSAIIGAIIFIPATFIYLFHTIIKTNDDTQKMSKQ